MRKDQISGLWHIAFWEYIEGLLPSFLFSQTSLLYPQKVGHGCAFVISELQFSSWNIVSFLLCFRYLQCLVKLNNFIALPIGATILHKVFQPESSMTVRLGSLEKNLTPFVNALYSLVYKKRHLTGIKLF